MDGKRTWISLPLLLLCVSGAQAGELGPSKDGGAAPSPVVNALYPLEQAETRPLRDETGWGRFDLTKGGVRVRRSVQLGERELVLGLKGPLMKRKRLGLVFELRF